MNQLNTRDEVLINLKDLIIYIRNINNTTKDFNNPEIEIKMSEVFSSNSRCLNLSEVDSELIKAVEF